MNKETVEKLNEIQTRLKAAGKSAAAAKAHHQTCRETFKNIVSELSRESKQYWALVHPDVKALDFSSMQKIADIIQDTRLAYTVAETKCEEAAKAEESAVKKIRSIRAEYDTMVDAMVPGVLKLGEPRGG